MIAIAALAPATPANAQTAPSIRTAVVGFNGTLVRGKGAVSSRLVSGPPGFYEVKFSTSVAKCAYFVGIGNADVFSEPGPFTGGATLSPFNVKTVVVTTFINAQTRANTAFSLMVVC